MAEKIYAAFNELSQRNTRQRKLIADQLIELANNGKDFTTDELWQDLRRLDARIGRATVFRSIEKLVDRGLLNRIEFADGTHHYRICGEDHHHHHLTCTQCRRVVEIDVCLPSEQLAAIGSQTHFSIEGHSLTLFGRCEECRIEESAAASLHRSDVRSETPSSTETLQSAREY
ncbi:MAG: transcriptional repressor [Ktedonobacteraceae bacterium]|nr:transcriptional repressor [Ktedonobacteraceae bacterium]